MYKTFSPRLVCICPRDIIVTVPYVAVSAEPLPGSSPLFSSSRWLIYRLESGGIRSWSSDQVHGGMRMHEELRRACDRVKGVYVETEIPFRFPRKLPSLDQAAHTHELIGTRVSKEFNVDGEDYGDVLNGKVRS